MTPAEFKACRIAVGLSSPEWAKALGYRLAKPRQAIHAMETGAKPISPQIARLAEMFRRHGVPGEYTRPRNLDMGRKICNPEIP